jgi:hypothetical protein
MFDVQIDSEPIRHESAATGIIAHLQATGEIVPAQTPSISDWSPEKSLAAAMLASGLIEIRDHLHNPSHRRLVAEDLEWVRSEAKDHLYSFERVCELLALDAAWVRAVVDRWCRAPRRRRIASWRSAA